MYERYLFYKDCHMHPALQFPQRLDALISSARNVNLVIVLTNFKIF